jgi:nicotinate-nucleotide pyrophosphorylase (carboxylating)
LKTKSDREIQRLILNALTEDIGDGDVTTAGIVPKDVHFIGEFIAKENGIIAGLEILKLVFETLDETLLIHLKVEDGDWIRKNDIITVISGSAHSILSGERIALNFLQRMSGIATTTKRYCDAVKHTSAKILDTRKTVPGLRILDKLAVKIGSGENHRFGLFDMVLIKENHITAAGSISEAVQRARQYIEKDKNKYQIEVEVTTIQELKEVLELNVDRIMLDNMSLDDLKTAVRVVGNQIPLEASGNVSLDNVSKIAETGVDFISVGQLTHSVKALDISLILKEQ